MEISKLLRELSQLLNLWHHQSQQRRKKNRSNSPRLKLKRFNKPPVHYSITLDYSDNEVGLTDVMRLNSRILTDSDGFPISRLMQVYKKEGVKAGHEFKLYCQDFQYEGRFAYVMANTASSSYDTATDLEKSFGAYFVAEATPTFSDQTSAYTFI